MQCAKVSKAGGDREVAASYFKEVRLEIGPDRACPAGCCTPLGNETGTFRKSREAGTGGLRPADPIDWGLLATGKIRPGLG